MDVTIIRANKGLMGGYKAVGDAEANTHVILLQEDYEALMGHYRRLVDDLNEKITQLTREKAQLAQKVSTYNRMVFQKDGELNETRARMKEAAAEAEAEIAEANARNENLMRIIRERANAARDLRPKKQRSGYLLLSVEDCRYRSGREEYSAQKVRLQSPYPATMETEVARTTIYRDLLEKGVGSSMGLTRIDDLSGSHREKIEAKMKYPELEAELEIGNGAYDFRFKCNTQRGYWEVEFLATRPITVPTDLLPGKSS